MKVLVLGAGGMAGHVIAISLREKGHSVTGLARRELPFCHTIVTDITNFSGIKSILDFGGFDAVINAIGILPGAISENLYNGIWINACLPHLLAELTKGASTRIIHLSTDCVFSGHDGGQYREADFRSANDAYGRSKALGELHDHKNLTFRMSIVGPDRNENGIGLFNWLMKQTGEVPGYKHALWTGVTTIALADAIHAALEQNLAGLYHLVNNTAINKYELLKLFSRLKITPVSIRPDDSYLVDKSMVNTRSDFRFEIPSYDEMIKDMGKWIEAHQALYPHYERECGRKESDLNKAVK